MNLKYLICLTYFSFNWLAPQASHAGTTGWSHEKTTPTGFKSTESLKKVAAFARLIKSNLRDPDSLTWKSIRATEDGGTICIEYFARNGFGGMNNEIAISVNGKKSQSVKDWNKHCLRGLEDFKNVKYMVP